MAHQSPQASASVAMTKKWKRFVIVVGVVVIAWALALQIKRSAGSGINSAADVEQPRINRVTVVLKGEKELSEPVYVPKDKRWYAIAVSADKVPQIKTRFGNGKIVPFSGWHEGALMPLQFMGPKGEVIFVDIQP